MSWEIWVTLSLLGVMIFALVRNIARPDMIMLGVLTVIMTLGLVPGSHFPSPEDLVTGFGNSALITVGVLYVVVTGLVQTGAMNLIATPLLGIPKSTLVAQLRLMVPVAFLSAFLNNTPIVAMFMPVVTDLCKKTGISPSKLFIPLSFATILGGTCTLIGTSTNLVVNGMLAKYPGANEPFQLFDLMWVGLPCAVVGITYLAIASRWLLPDRGSAIGKLSDPREYTIEMLVEDASPIIGKTIEQAGLRHLPGMYLVEIERHHEIIAAVSSDQRLQTGDRLVFVGVVESVVDLQKIRGLRPATEQVFKLDAPRSQRCLVEAVVSDSCPLVGMTIRDGRFRSTYNAAVIAAARNGERIRKKIGDIVLRPGDTLLLETLPSFVDQQRNSRDFFLVGRIEGSTPPHHEKAWIAMAILVVMVIVAGFEWLSMLHAGILAAAAMIVTRCCTAGNARRSIDWEVLLVIGAALGIGVTMQTTGVDMLIASRFIGLAGDSPWAVLLCVYFATMLLTEIMSNNAAAALMFPIAMAAAKGLGPDVDYHPYVIAIMIAASCGFATPIGYQTNLMVYGPGGYKFSDYIRIGVPLNLLVMGVAMVVIPIAWPFYP